MKVFLDTNVLVSAVTTRGLCADIVQAVLAEHQDVLVAGDQDLLGIAAAAPLPIVTPRGLWELLRANPRAK